MKSKAKIYFPNFKTTIKNGLLVSISAVLISMAIIGINYGMSSLMSFILTLFK